MIANVANLALWEWFKLQRRWMLWVLLAFALLFAQLAVWGQFFSYNSLRSTGGEVTVPGLPWLEQPGRTRRVACNDLLSGDAARQPSDLDPQVVEGLRTQCRQQAAQLPQRLQGAYQNLTLPGSIPNALGTLQTLGLILIAILTASAIGIDYGSGTLRSVLTRGTGRWPYLAAKVLTLAVLAALGLLIAMASVAISSVIAGSIAGAAPGAATVAAATWSDAGIALWKVWVSILPYLALTVFVTVVGRSSAAGMAIGLGYYFAEFLIVGLLRTFFSWWQNVADYLLVWNISAWTGGGVSGFSPLGELLPDSTHAIVVLGVYTVALTAIAFRLFERRDVPGATGGG